MASVAPDMPRFSGDAGARTYDNIPYFTILYYNVVDYIILYCNIPCGATIYYNMLYYTMLYLGLFGVSRSAS